MSDPPFTFPILSIPDPNPLGRWQDMVGVSFNPADFTVGSREDIEKRFYVGNLIMDADGRSWRVLKLVNLGFGGTSFWGKLVARVFGSYDIHHELSEELKLPFSDIKERVCATILSNPGSHLGEAAIERGDLSPEREQALLTEFLTKIHDAATPFELIAVIDYNNYV